MTSAAYAARNLIDDVAVAIADEGVARPATTASVAEVMASQGVPAMKDEVLSGLRSIDLPSVDIWYQVVAAYPKAEFFVMAASADGLVVNPAKATFEARTEALLEVPTTRRSGAKDHVPVTLPLDISGRLSDSGIVIERIRLSYPGS